MSSLTNYHNQPIIKPAIVGQFQSGQHIDQIPEFDKLHLTIENNGWHHNQDTYSHTQDVLVNLDSLIQKANPNIIKPLNIKIGKLTRGELLWYATLLHDIAKPDVITHNGSETNFPKHEEEGSKLARTIVSRLGIDQSSIDYICGIIADHGKLHRILGEEDFVQGMFDLFYSLQPAALELVLLAYADTIGSYQSKTDPEDYENRIKFYSNKIANWRE